MAHYVNNPDYKHGTPETIGVLLTNLGTPDAPTTGALRRYLREFLSDPRVVEAPRLIWFFVLNFIVLLTRPARSAAAYREVWTDEGSPLLSISKQQAAAIEKQLQARLKGPVKVALGMRYGNPSIESAMEELRQANCTRLLVFPLYPQYSASTSGSTFDAVADVLKRWRWVPQFRMIMSYHDNKAWVEAVAQSIREHREKQPDNGKLMMSFHGLPKRYLTNGDPYFCQCHASARMIAENLGLKEDEWQVVFQSRFGKEEWLQPYCDQTLEQWGKAGVEGVDIICPGFSADCLETLEEVAIQNRDIFQQAGGGHYAYIPALNDRPDHIDALTSIIERNLCGWQDMDAGDQTQHQEDAKRRALAMGAPR